MIAATLDQARTAHAKLADLLRDLAEIRGIGIAKVGDGYALRVNLSVDLNTKIIPPDIDGVPVVVEVVGFIRPL